MITDIRNARATDIGALQAISRATIRANYASFLGTWAVERFIESGASDRYVEDNIATGTVILADGVLAGLCVCKENAIDLMMIDHRLHGRGLGAMLLKHCEAWMFERYEVLTLNSFTRNARANAFYAKNGWVAGETFVDPDSGYAMVRFDKPRGDRSATS